MSSRIPLTQALVDARWQEIGAPLPAPLIPKSHVGAYMAASKGGIRWTDAFGKMLKPSKADAKAFHDFWTFFTKVAIDPYRKQSGISKVAGGILKVASIVVPVFSTVQAVAEVGNAGLALEKANSGSDEKLAARVMEPAVDAFMAKEAEAAAISNAAKDAELAAQIKALTSPAIPTASTSTLTPIPLTSPSSSAAQIQIPVFSPKPTTAPKNYFGLSEVEAAVLAAGLLGVLLWSRR